MLKRADFAAFECSWDDKAGGLRRIAADLNVGIDSFVFCDDNPAECELVRQELPEVAVVHLGSEPAAVHRDVRRRALVDMPAYTPEDLGRSAAYQRARCGFGRAGAGDGYRQLPGGIADAGAAVPARGSRYRAAWRSWS